MENGFANCLTLQKQMHKFFLYGLSLLLISSCSQDSKDQSLLPSSIGAPAEMIVITDSAQWFGSVGDSILSCVAPNISKLLEPEYLFTLRYIRPDAFSGILQRHNNLLMVTTWQTQSFHSEKLRSFFPKIQQEQQADKVVFEQDLFAKGQMVAMVFAQDSLSAAKLIGQNKEKIRSFFLNKENQRLRDRLYAKVKPNQKVIDQLKAQHGFSLKVPFNYRIEKDTAGFVWIRYSSGDNDQDILISYQPYRSVGQFQNDSLTAWRDATYKSHIYVNRDRDPNSYLVTENQIPVDFETINFLGSYGKRMKGLWRSNTFALGGGPFTAVAFVSPDNQRIFVVEGFVFAPGIPKREIIRELETIISTFEFAK
jgi:hypothetical protein